MERAFTLLDQVATAGRDGLTLSELAAALPMSMSTAHRYVSTLLELGALQRDDRGRLRPGLRLLTLAGALLAEDDIRRVASPFLEEIVALTGETVHLGVLARRRIVYIDKVESPQSVRLVSEVGASVAMHCTAMGKAVLAYQDRRDRRAVLSEPLESPTPNTLTGARLAAELDAIRDSGFAIDDEENELGVRCLAAPIFGATGAPIGAVSVSGPAGRFSREKVLSFSLKLTDVGRDISRQLGFREQAVIENRSHSLDCVHGDS